MKKYLLGVVVALTLSSCNDDYLEKYPKDALSEKTAFNKADDFKTFSWGFYSVFTDANFYRAMDGSFDTDNADMLAGWLTWKNKTVDGNQMRTQLKSTGASGNGWSFAAIKRCNLMLQNIEGSTMSQADKDHYRAIGLFWRAYSYYELISRFGDVPWIDQVVAETDTDIIYGPRTPRKEVADHLLADLQWAETHIRPTGDGANTINTDCVQALMSRFFLFEGTWRKYHGLGDSDKYLDECIRVSKILTGKYPTVANSYDMLLNSPDLKSYPGIILYKQFVTGVITHLSGRYERTNGLTYDMPKCTVENYLCTDGKPISTSPLYQGDLNTYKEFRNRDLRLLGTVIPPYSQKAKPVGGITNPDYSDVIPNYFNDLGYYAGDPSVTDNMEFSNVVKNGFPGTTKRLPVFVFNGVIAGFNSPNFPDVGIPGVASFTGYTLWRRYNTWDDVNGNTSSKPVFWIEETLLNLAEASFERGQFSQSVADITINKLRPRAGVANMVVANINAGWDTKRDQTVDPVLWEIRRERMSELMCMGFGFQDVRRWKKGPWYINKPNLGIYINRANWRDLNKTTGAVLATTNTKWVSTTNLPLVNKDFTGTNLQAGYVKRFDDPTKIGKGWLDKYYLEWIPTNQIVLNSNIKQNPGW